MRNIWLEGMMGLVVGDALGMPVQFCERKELRECPITQMEGYGTYNMPEGTWSDDSSMALATLESLRRKDCVDLEDIMQNFVKWLLEGEFTPYGTAFDMGNTCMYAINGYIETKEVTTCGKTGERANGNGALMRILPACLFAYEKELAGEMTPEEAVEWMHKITALTHNHLRAQMASGIYYFLIKAVLEEKGGLAERLQIGMDDAFEFYRRDIANLVEFSHYGRMFDLSEFAGVKEEDIKSSGYVVDSLEAVVWCLITTTDFESALLKVVNLGDDADTTGAIAGGLGALYYGYENIPEKWLKVIKRREWIEGYCDL